MKEIWKSVKGYEGLYEVSDMGNVRSLRRKTTKGKILKPAIDKDGYLRVSLSKNNQIKNYPVHRLVAIAFVDGHSLENNIINHKNEVKNDNRAENLEWCDPKYNTNYNNMPMRRADWCKSPIIAIKGDEVLHYESISQAARELKCNRGNISACLLNYHGRKTVKGYKFKIEKEKSK